MTILGIQEGRGASTRPVQIKTFGRSFQNEMQYSSRACLCRHCRNKRHGHDKEGGGRHDASGTVRIIRVTRAVSRCMSVIVYRLTLANGDTRRGRDVMDMMVGQNTLQGKGAHKQPRDHELVPVAPRCS